MRLLLTLYGISVGIFIAIILIQAIQFTRSQRQQSAEKSQ